MKNRKSALKKDFEKTAAMVSWVSIVGNLLLSVFKAAAGVIAHSGAMISDAVHSASDIISSVVVMIGIKISSKESDEAHPYGHERFECVAAIVLSVILFLTGLFIGVDAVKKLLSAGYQTEPVPGLLALVAAVISIVTKEAMYWYTRFYARMYDSGALMADAWHHRSDALSSVGALVGIAGARMGYLFLDSLASVVICAFILKAAVDIFRDAIDKMIDRSCDDETELLLRQCALEQAGVESVDLLTTRMFANRIYVDIEIGVDRGQTLLFAHRAAEQVHDAIENRFEKVKHIMVHVNPR